MNYREDNLDYLSQLIIPSAANFCEVLWTVLDDVTWLAKLHIMIVKLHKIFDGLRNQEEDISSNIVSRVFANDMTLSSAMTPALRVMAKFGYHCNGLVQEKRNSISNAVELHLFCTNPSMYNHTKYWSVLEGSPQQCLSHEYKCRTLVK